MVRLKNIELNQSLNCVKLLIKGNIPLCLIDFKQKDSVEILREIAFKADLFIAVENISSLEEAYLSAGNGAQFFILNDFSENLLNELTNNGFYFIPRVKNKEELQICEKLKLQCIITDNYSLLDKSSNIFNVYDNIKLSDSDNVLFKIIDLPRNETDYEKWINNEVKEMLGLNYSEVVISTDAEESDKSFAEIFASTQKCKLINGHSNYMILECNNIKSAASYFKWRNMFIDPEHSVVVDNKIIESPLDKKMNGFTIILREKEII